MCTVSSLLPNVTTVGVSSVFDEFLCMMVADLGEQLSIGQRCNMFFRLRVLYLRSRARERNHDAGVSEMNIQD